MAKCAWLLLAAIVIAGCAAAPVASAPSAGGPVTQPPASVTPSAALSASASAGVAASASPGPAASAQAPVWHAVAPATGLGDLIGLNVVGWFKDRWIAFGDTTDGPAAWWSMDGSAWTAADVHPDGALKSPDVHVTAIASNGETAVAVASLNENTSGGSVDIPLADGRSIPQPVVLGVARSDQPRVVPAATCEGLGSADAAVLTTTDGVTWTRVPDSRVLRGQPMLGVTEFQGGFVAAGGADGSGRSAAWTSPDGRDWTRAPDSAALQAGWIGDIATLGNSVVAVGGSACGNTGGVPRAWSSVDGRTWSLAPGLVSGTCCGAAYHVAAGKTIAASDGVASAPGGGDLAGTTWTSTDGMTWAPHPQPDRADPSWIGRIAAASDGFLEAGGGLWASPDGVTWTPVAPADSGLTGIAIGPNGALAVGESIWAGPASVVAHP